MDHSAISSSRVANLGLIKEEEDLNTLQPSSLHPTPRGHLPYAISSSEYDPPSKTPNHIPGNEDVESITTFEEYDNALSEIAPRSSLRTIKSSLRRMALVIRESLVSARSMLFTPLFGAPDMNIFELVQYLQSKHSRAKILDITTYQCRSSVKHMFVVLRLKQGHTECWLRLDCRAEDPSNAPFLFSSMQGSAKDDAKVASKSEGVIEASDVKEHSRIVFEKPPSLMVLESLLVAIYEESKDYGVWPENCWFFCSLMQEHLSHRHGGHFAFGDLYRPTLGSNARARISGRLQDGMQLADLSVPWSLSLLYRVVPRPFMPSAVTTVANGSHGIIHSPRYLLFTPDGTRILHGSHDRIIRVWDLSLRELIKIPTKNDSQVGDWASLLDGQIIVSGSSNGSYNFWYATSGAPVRFSTASRGSKGLDFTRLASAPDDLTAQRWERVIRDTDRWQGYPRVRNRMHNRVAYRSEGSILVDENSSNTRIANSNVRPRLQGDPMLSSSGKSILFHVDGSHNSCLWNIDTQTVYRLDQSISISNYWGKDWSPDGHYVVIERQSDFTVWDTRTGALVSILNFGSIFVGTQRFSPDGRYFAAASNLGKVKLWDMKLALLRGPYRSNRPLPVNNGMVDFSR